jgi:hypothetical protein
MGEAMITNMQYFQAKPHNSEQEVNCTELLSRVSALLANLSYTPPYCPNTGTQISGSKGGSGDGGFRLDTATTGAATSSHKEGMGVDVYDPAEALDNMIADDLLEQFDLYREHPSATVGWCHLSTRAPHSGHRTFYP